MTTPEPSRYIDLARYPVDRPGSTEYAALLAQIRADLQAEGCAVLNGFLRPDRIADLVAEAEGVSSLAHRSYSRTNAYFTADDPMLPESHPNRLFYDCSNAFIPADNFDPKVDPAGDL